MRYLLILFLMSTYCYAIKNWVPENKGNTVYANYKSCVVKSGQECYSFNPIEKDLETLKVKEVQVDNPEKPIYAEKEDITDCVLHEYTGLENESVPENACQKLVGNINVGTEEDPVFEYPLCTNKDYKAAYGEKKDLGLEGEGYAAYCTKLLGYEQKTVKKLVIDQTLVTEKEERERINALKEKLVKLKEKHKKKNVEKKAWQDVKNSETLTVEESNLIDQFISEIESAKND